MIRKKAKQLSSDKNQQSIIFAKLCEQSGIPLWGEEVLFWPEDRPDPDTGKVRKFRVDYWFINPETGKEVALEVEGGAFTRGRHTRPVGFLNDMIKYNELARQGVTLIRCTPDQLFSEKTLQLILDCLEIL